MLQLTSDNIIQTNDLFLHFTVILRDSFSKFGRHHFMYLTMKHFENENNRMAHHTFESTQDLRPVNLLAMQQIWLNIIRWAAFKWDLYKRTDPLKLFSFLLISINTFVEMKWKPGTQRDSVGGGAICEFPCAGVCCYNSMNICSVYICYVYVDWKAVYWFESVVICISENAKIVWVFIIL